MAADLCLFATFIHIIDKSKTSFHLKSICIHCIHPQYLNRNVCANTEDPDQTAPKSSLIRVFSICQSTPDGTKVFSQTKVMDQHNASNAEVLKHSM